VRLVDELRPRAFVAENVAGLVAGAAKGYFKRIVAGLQSCGYRVRAKLLDAQWLGVPQARKRVIIVGMRDDLGIEPPFPGPLPYRYSILDACPWLGAGQLEVRQGGWDGHEAANLAAPMPTVQASQHQARITCRNSTDFKPHAVSPDLPSPTLLTGKDWVQVSLRTTYGPDNRHRYREQSLDAPSPTMMAAGAGGSAIVQSSIPGDGNARDPETGEPLWARYQGDGRRRLTIPEVRRLCSFPDDYELVGTYEQRWARLGNSVPPLMARAVGAAVAEALV
jgi:DNA (cytosine-5)-methyltransferase 1